MTSTTDPAVTTRWPGTEAETRSYYGMPVLKEPEWTWEVPWYLFTGGLAGASSTFSALARLTGRAGVADRAVLVAAGAAAVSPVLLVKDLGRPSRFYNMLRVFKPTSAMSMGSWLLATYATTASASATLQVARRLPRLRASLEAVSAVLGLPMATYTAVLMSDSSIPVWHEARDELPFVFAGSAMASAGAASVLLDQPAPSAPGRRAVIAGVALEVGAEKLMERRLAGLAQPYEEGDAGRYGKAATACSLTGAALVAVGGGGARWRRAAGVGGAILVLAGSACQRWSVFRAGFQSAREPKYVVGPQRQRGPSPT